MIANPTIAGNDGELTFLYLLKVIVVRRPRMGLFESVGVCLYPIVRVFNFFVDFLVTENTLSTIGLCFNPSLLKTY